MAKLTEFRNDLFRKAFITPEVDFDKLEELFVIKFPPQWESFREELDWLQTMQNKGAAQP